MSPWLFVLPLIIVLYFLIMGIRSIRDLWRWYREGREFAEAQKRAKELRQQKRAEKLKMPALKERPSESTKPGTHPSKKPPERPKP